MVKFFAPVPKLLQPHRHTTQSAAYQAQQASLNLLPALTMARKAAAADPDSGTTNVNIADFQRTRDSVSLDLDMAAVLSLPRRVPTAHQLCAM
jgi:hypothetical protein